MKRGVPVKKFRTVIRAVLGVDREKKSSGFSNGENGRKAPRRAGNQ